ncbi:MAG TPA: amidohydrolase family protein [Chloroflexota bacterium]|nr:amidohydrolase family protein [Chloroflexota bacterium]
MRPNRYPVIDGDGHVMERNDELEQHLSEEYPLHEANWFNAFSPFPSLDGWFRGFGRSSPGLRDYPDPAMWLSFLDDCGIERAVLFPTLGLAAGLIQDPSWAVTICRAYNNWLYTRYTRQSPRFLGVALLPVQDISAAVQELRRAATELGFVAGLLPAVTALHKAYGHRDFWPLYAEAERLGLALTVHGGSGQRLGLDHLPTFIETHTLDHPFSLLIQLTSMVFHGVFEAFPGLRVAYLEAGCGWVPYMMDRLDEEYERRGKRWAPTLTKRPSEYLRGGQVYTSIEVEERTLPYVLELFGEDHVFFASDYPHERSRPAYLEDIPRFAERPDLADTAKRKILADNARRFYRLDER